MKINEQKAQQVRDGVAAIEHTGLKEDLPKLRELLDFTFSECNFICSGNFKYHFAGHYDANLWNCSDLLPSGLTAIPLKDFFVEEVEEKPDRILTMKEFIETPWGTVEDVIVKTPKQELVDKVENDFQIKVKQWLLLCFGEEIANDKIERNHRFLEESLELVQSIGCTKSEAHQLVDYVFDRPVGETYQEIGGVMVTLAALCCANDYSMAKEGEKEVTRIYTKIDKIREKQAAKPKHSPLPQSQQQSTPLLDAGEVFDKNCETYRRKFEVVFAMSRDKFIELWNQKANGGI